MEKSRLGISPELFAAALYFIGATGGVTAVMLASGYVLFFEDNKLLKRTAVKALIMTVSLTIICMLTGFAANLLYYMLNAVSSGYNIANPGADYAERANLSYIINIVHSAIYGIETAARVLQVLVLGSLGFRAYKTIDIKIKRLDKILDRHL
ncbi:MAG: hypothetical protein FWH10_08475 [Oscillospiraceae bacterium]|nr:hypothetical protein [Oscillospiraceae bacterium]